ncbi:cytochrome P450, partial [Thelephora ganbajun]
PPGPKGYPIIGNTLDIPRDVAIYKTFASMAERCNTDVLYLKLATADFVVLTSSEAISDLFERRSNIYSDRVSSLVKLTGHSWSITLMPYGKGWRNARRLFHEFMHSRAVVKFDDYQRKHAHRFLLQLAETPDDFLNHAKFTVAALVLEMTYGFNIKSHEDKFLRAAEQAVEYAERGLVPGAFLVDTIPMRRSWLFWIWFPGAGFKAFARVGRGVFDVAVDGPLEYAKESLKASLQSSCSTGLILGLMLEISRTKATLPSLHHASTTLTTLRGFFLAAALHPHVVKKAQAELDHVVG